MKRLALLTLFIAGTAQALRPTEPEALLVAGARAALTPDGPLLAGKLAKDVTISVESARDERYQFAEPGAGFRLYLHTAPKYLADLTVAADLVPAITNEPLGDSSPGMKLPEGTRLASVKAAKAGYSKVRVQWTWETGSFRVDGYVDSDKVTKTIRRMERSHVRFAPDVTAPGNFKLTAPPGGKMFARGTGKARVDLQTLETQGTYTLVRTGQGAVGWIATKELGPRVTGDTLGGIGTIGHGSGSGSAPSAGSLKVGTQLHTKIDGAVVGEVTGQFDFTAQQTKNGWQRFDLPTRFGTAKVWAR